MSAPTPRAELDESPADHASAGSDDASRVRFERFATMVGRLFDVPSVAISVRNRHGELEAHTWGSGLYDPVFCAQAAEAEDVMVRWSGSASQVDGSAEQAAPSPMLLAGAPLVLPGGTRIGALCVANDQATRHFTEDDRDDLRVLAGAIVDWLEMLRLQEERQVGQARFENIAATSPDAIICVDSRGRVTFWNRAAERLFGYAREEVLGLPSEPLVHGDAQSYYAAELDRLHSGRPLRYEGKVVDFDAVRKDGSTFPAELSLSTWSDGEAMNAGAIVRDVTDRREFEEGLRRLALTDPLTDLPNRSAWHAHVDTILQTGAPAAVVLLDLDGFKEVNDSFGHTMGDTVLREVADRMRAACHTGATVARLGGDEFVAVALAADEVQARAVAQRMFDAIAGGYVVARQCIALSASAGIALYPSHASTPEDLLVAADLALYEAKSSGKNVMQVFEPRMRDVASARRELAADLRRATDEEQFVLHYQPQVDRDGKLLGVEALIRWRHPERGLLAPAAFIDELGASVAAPAVGQWVLRTACRQVAKWRESVPHLVVGVNLFDAQMRLDDLPDIVTDALEQAGLPADALEIELVETILTDEEPATLERLRRLRATGIRLAFDDYGTGFASLSLLKHYPVSRLKIDSTFVRGIHDDKGNAAVVDSILHLARTFGLDAIAEGVETVDELEFLRAKGCEAFQGYLFGRPESAEDLAQHFCLGAEHPRGDVL